MSLSIVLANPSLNGHLSLPGGFQVKMNGLEHQGNQGVSCSV